MNYGDTIGLMDNKWSAYLSGRSDENNTDAETMTWLKSWEKWTVVDPNNENSTDPVNYGDTIALKNNKWNTYLSGRSDENNTAAETMTWLKSWEKWTIVDPNVESSTSGVNIGDTIALKNNKWNTYLSGRSDENNTAAETMTWLKSWEKWTTSKA